MRLRASLLHRSLNVGSVLAMTATATTTTLDAIMSALDIPFTNLIQNAHLRDNLRLSASLIKNRQVRCFYFTASDCTPFNFPSLILLNVCINDRMKDLLVLIKSPPFADVKGIIVYCKFQVCIWTSFSKFSGTWFQSYVVLYSHLHYTTTTTTVFEMYNLVCKVKVIKFFMFQV